MSGPLTVLEMCPGLYRWQAAHPEWDPAAPRGSSSDWPQMVGCALYELPGLIVLFDPLIPTEEEREPFLAWLDDLVAGRAVSVLTTIHWHRRDRDQLAERYAANSERAWNFLPPGVLRKPLRGAAETVYWLPAVATLVFGDRLVGGSGGGVEVCPESWLSRVSVDRAGLAGLMRPLLELPVERLLVSHGEPVTRDGRSELAKAIRRARGE